MSSHPAHALFPRAALTALPHPQVYHVRCAKCDAITIHEVEADTVRMICPACEHRLTIPGAIHHECPHCHEAGEYRHILAGHSTSCAACGRTIVLAPILSRTWHQHPHSHAHEQARARFRRHPERTLAFSDSAERSLILVAAAIAMLIFVILVSMM